MTMTLDRLVSLPAAVWRWLVRDIGGVVINVGCVIWAGLIGFTEASSWWIAGPLFLIAMSRSEAVAKAKNEGFSAGYLHATCKFLETAQGSGEIIFTINDNRAEQHGEIAP